MISHINSADQWLNVYSPGKPYVNGYNSGLNVGSVRYNTNMNGGTFETYDGSNWVSLEMGAASISLSSRAQHVLQWAEQQMFNEQRLAEMAAKHPTVADAVEQYNKAAEQLEILITLCEKNNES